MRGRLLAAVLAVSPAMGSAATLAPFVSYQYDFFCTRDCGELGMPENAPARAEFQLAAAAFRPDGYFDTSAIVGFTFSSPAYTASMAHGWHVDGWGEWGTTPADFWIFGMRASLYDGAASRMVSLLFDAQRGEDEPRTYFGASQSVDVNCVDPECRGIVYDGRQRWASFSPVPAVPVPAPVPLPAAAWLLLAGIGAVGALKLEWQRLPRGREAVR